MVVGKGPCMNSKQIIEIAKKLRNITKQLDEIVYRLNHSVYIKDKYGKPR